MFIVNFNDDAFTWTSLFTNSIKKLEEALDRMAKPRAARHLYAWTPSSMSMDYFMKDKAKKDKKVLVEWSPTGNDNTSNIDTSKI